MDSEGLSGCAVVFMVLLYLGAAIGAGILAWNWVEPEDFGTGVLFVLAWGLISAVGAGLVRFIAAIGLAFINEFVGKN